MDEGFANARRMMRLPFLAQKAMSVRKGASPSEVVYEEDRLKLLHYLSDEPPRYQTPLVFVFALVNRPYILDLKEGRSVVSHYVKAGFDTYLIDWGSPTDSDSHLTLDDYVNGYMANVVDYLCERTGAPQVNMLGYCMGGTMSAMFTAMHQKKIRNLLLLAAGIDFATREGLLNLWTDPKYFDVDKFVDAFGNAPAEFLQASFQILKPVQNLIEKPINFFEKADDDKFVDDFFTMETWLNDNIAVPGGVFREFVKCLYQKNLLVKNRMPVGKHIVDLRKITCPVLNIMAQNDDLVPCAQSAPFNDLVGSKDRKSIVVPAGHIGLAVGSKAQKEAWPEACRWLAERSR
ncbi:MAG: Poly(R)-hydroxyalkanoic acid synthase, class PhaC subunit [Pedosphaera sp.]|nr:Poly(R)-hydroxyalkanoic acid synthase, class PhaC subunit [Pedosphaera sp.]